MSLEEASRARRQSEWVRRLSIILLLALACAGLTSLARGESTTSTRQNGSMIVFVRGDKLFLMKTNGSNQRQLVRHSGNAYDPVWSPDGSRIAAVLGLGIWVMNADGPERRRLTTDPDFAPAWSPDGSRIAFERRIGSRGPALMVMNADGSGKRALAIGGDPSWSADGSKIVFERNDEALFVMNADGSAVRRLTRKAKGCSTTPAWSPDGAQIAFVGNPGCRTYGQDIWVMRADGSRPRQVSKLGGSFNPAWSPDSRKLLFDSNRHGSGSTDIFVVSSDGTKEKRLTRGAGYNASPDWRPAPGAS